MGMGGGSGGMASSGMETYRAALSASQEVPPNASIGTGSAEVMVNPSTMDMTYRVTFSGLSGPATMGHIHGPAPSGQNAGVKVPFPSVAQSPVTGGGKLTAEQYADLKAGRYYVNIHTAANPGGEIRGQLSR
ncbi:CHRD domain-containing protein [Ramlibacter sp. MAH-25]|uniref:CHRD domain-containing protein n=2 Tax=Comamonadaceae TaxID=80864 RepID=A0A6N8IR22_9BURK|nr:CHRD domain-containing protein [Ramlibacter sp. CGMCC 1.13660]MVQ29298.1 CHRD domain-containing protein [Ramlibacter pinisoli]